MGRNIRYRPAAIEAWTAAQEVNPTEALPDLLLEPTPAPVDGPPDFDADIVEPPAF